MVSEIIYHSHPAGLAPDFHPSAHAAKSPQRLFDRFSLNAVPMGDGDGSKRVHDVVAAAQG